MTNMTVLARIKKENAVFLDNIKWRTKLQEIVFVVTNQDKILEKLEVEQRSR